VLFECNPVSGYYGLVESKPGLGTVPINEFPNRVIVGAFERDEVRLFKTADFDCSRSTSFRTVFGARLRLLFAIEDGLQMPRRKA
jgi:hypothetical protein